MTTDRDWLESAQRHPYIAGVLMIGITTALAFLTEPILHAANLDLVYLLAVFVIALYCGERPAIFTAIAAAFVFDWCFVVPRFTWSSADLPYLTTLLVFVMVAIVTARVAARARQQVLDRAARETAEALSASKDELLHKISHELRSPMTAVLGWTQLIRSTELEATEMESSLAGLETSAQLLRHLIDDLLDASRAASGKLGVRLQPTRLARVIEQALDIVEVAARTKNVTLRRALDDVGALADEVRIEQIVTNLMVNAIKFTPAGGSVGISLSHRDGYARITVTDSGEGIPSEFLPHIFEAFSQADHGNPRGGLGLGLSIVKYLVEAHRGTISVSSDPGHGSTFVVTLPALDDHGTLSTAAA